MYYVSPGKKKENRRRRHDAASSATACQRIEIGAE